MPVNLFESHFAKLGLTKIVVLGAGSFGEVSLYKYSGTDPNILELCDAKGQIAIKVPPDNQERLIAEHLAKSREEHPELDTQNVNRVGLLIDNGQLLGILTKYEWYLDYQNNEFRTFSANLEKFLKNTFHPHYKFQKTGPKIQAAVQENFGVFMGQLASSMYKAQEQLHQHSILHLDTATRNFMVNTLTDKSGTVIGIEAKINDFGQSNILEPGQNVGTFVDTTKVPKKWIDYEAMWNRQPSILTDMLAQKTSIIGMLGLTLRKCSKEGDVLPRSFSSDESNEKVLINYLKNITDLINGCDDPQKKKELELFIECYETYLTTMPSTNDFNLAMESDKVLFIAATTLFVTKSYEQILKDIPEPGKQLISLQRLQSIEINDSGLESKIQQSIEELVPKVYEQILNDSANPEQRLTRLECLQSIEISDSGLQSKIQQSIEELVPKVYEQILNDSTNPEQRLTRLQYLQSIEIKDSGLKSKIQQSIKELVPKIYEQILNNSAEPQQRLISLQYLQSIEINDSELESKIQQSIEELVAIIYEQILNDSAEPQQRLISLQNLQFIKITDAQFQTEIQHSIEQLQSIVFFETAEARLAFLGFEKLSGRQGAGTIYKYSGDNPALKAVCDANGYIVIKLSYPPDQQSILIAEHLVRSKAEHPELDSQNINQMNSLVDEGFIIGTLHQFEYYVDTYQDQPVLATSSLEGFLKNTFHPQDESQKTGPKLQSAFQENFGVFMGQIASSMHKAQDQLHQHSLLHLDTGTRNFLVRNKVNEDGTIIGIDVKISNFDQAAILKPDEDIYMYTRDDNGVPVKWMDQQVLWKREASIKTDLFAQKAAIIGMLGLTLDEKSNIEASVLDRGDLLETDTNESVLKRYLQHIKDMVAECKDPQKKKELELFIECYEPYLTTMPNTTNFKAARDGDMESFLAANTLFVAKNYEQILKDTPNFKQRLISLQRLQGIDINDDGLKSNIEKSVVEVLDTQRRQQQFIARSLAYKDDFHRCKKTGLNLELDRIVKNINYIPHAYESLSGIFSTKQHRSHIKNLVDKVNELMKDDSMSPDEKFIKITHLVKDNYKELRSNYSPSSHKNRTFLEELNSSQKKHYYTRLLGVTLADIYTTPGIPGKLKQTDLDVAVEVQHINKPTNKKEYSKLSFAKQEDEHEDLEGVSDLSPK